MRSLGNRAEITNSPTTESTTALIYFAPSMRELHWGQLQKQIKSREELKQRVHVPLAPPNHSLSQPHRAAPRTDLALPLPLLAVCFLVQLR